MTEKLERILPTVQKPARYVGGEYGQTMKDKRSDIPMDGPLELEPADDGAGHGEEFGVFSPAAGVVAGEEPEERGQDAQKVDDI